MDFDNASKLDRPGVFPSEYRRHRGGEATFETLNPLLKEAYDRAVERYARSGRAVGDARAHR